MRGVAFSEGSDATGLEQTKNKTVFRVVLEFPPLTVQAGHSLQSKPGTWFTPLVVNRAEAIALLV